MSGLLELFNEEIEKIGGVYATYLTIQSELNPSYKWRQKLSRYKSHKWDNPKPIVRWTPIEKQLIRETMHIPPGLLLDKFPRRSYGAIKDERIKQRRLMRSVSLLVGLAV